MGKEALKYDTDVLQTMIITIRGRRVILSSDLAELYGVQPRVLNQAVKRNDRRFPVDFMFKLTSEETEHILRSRSQFVTLKRGANVKYLPYAFTEHGAVMAANILRSPRAEEMSIFVVRAFIKLREMLTEHTQLAKKLDELEKKYDNQFQTVFDAIRALMAEPEKSKRTIGFKQ